MSIPRYFKEYKSLSFQDYILIVLIGYITFNRLVEQSGSQKLLNETIKQAKSAETTSKEALKRTETIEAINQKMAESLSDINKLNETTMSQVQDIDKQYRYRKDTTYQSFNNRLNAVKVKLLELQKLQKSL